jgi:hypothetical protein
MAELIYKIDGFVYDLEEEGYDTDEIFAALDEYLAIQEDLVNVAPL